MRKQALSTFKSRITKLRKDLPAVHPVRVRRVDVGNGLFGDCSLVQGRHPYFLIRVHKDLDAATATDTLVHEWAHALTWTDAHPSLTDHDEYWGISFSRVYRVLWPDELGS